MISEAKIRQALRQLSFGLLRLEIERGTNAELTNILQLLMRSSDLFFKYPNRQKERLRDIFYSEISGYFEQNLGIEWSEKLSETISVLKRTEIGYRSLLDLLRKLPFRKKSAEVQSSAAIALIIRRLQYVDNRTWRSISRARQLEIASADLEATLEDGTKFSVDSVTVGYLGNLATTLTMLAIENEWISSDGVLVLPALTDCTEQEIEESSGTELLATSWRRWERVEQRRRYWGGAFLEIEQGEHHSHLPETSRIYFEYVPDRGDQLDWVANERLKDSASQALLSLDFEEFAHDGISDITRAKLPPEQYVNAHEIYWAAFLSAVLGIDVRDDQTEYSGLRIVEWLRGYSTLSEIAIKKAGPGRAAKEFLIQFGPGELENQLNKAGLSLAKAEIFVSRVTFSLRSDDLFDCPLLKFRDGALRLLVPAAIYADVSAVTYSNLISLGHTFEKKGKRFEKAVCDFFRAKGFGPYSIKAGRGGNEYEIDVLLPWDGYLFVFECKNKALSNNHPIRSYYFRKERDGFIGQVRRQVEGLRLHPDMSVQAGGIDPRIMTIVPCVLYELPYSEPGLSDGVFITDWYSLSRFFSDRYLSFRRPYDLFRKHKLVHRTAIYSLWSGEQPTPSDLLRQLDDPVQIRLVLSGLTEIDSVFATGDNAFGLTKEYYRKKQNLNEISRVLGFNAQEAKDDDRRMKKEVAYWNKRFERKRLLAELRSFREMRKRDQK